VTRFLLAVFALLLLAPAASASTASREGTTINVVGGDESSNINFDGGGFYWHVNDAAGITAGEGCESLSATTVRCGSSSEYTLSGITANLGAGDDSFTQTGCYPEVVNGGTGNDTIYTGCLDDVVHGNEGNDFISASDGADQVFGDAGNDEVRGHNGSDQVTGGPGVDQIYGDSGTSTKDGSDRIDSRDGEQDQVSCGFGADVVEADDVDVVEGAEFCETVNRQSTEPGPGQDDEAPGLTATAKKRRSIAKATKKPGYGIGVVVTEDCELFASLTISKANAKKFGLGRRRLTLDKVRADVNADSYAIGLWATGKNARKLKALAALRGTARVPALIRVTATDANGNWNERKLKVKLVG
jgi:hypothetical protein